MATVPVNQKVWKFEDPVASQWADELGLETPWNSAGTRVSRRRSDRVRPLAPLAGTLKDPGRAKTATQVFRASNLAHLSGPSSCGHSISGYIA